jgi:phosphohistidine phosphatase SixA
MSSNPWSHLAKIDDPIELIIGAFLIDVKENLPTHPNDQLVLKKLCAVLQARLEQYRQHECTQEECLNHITMLLMETSLDFQEQRLGNLCLDYVRNLNQAIINSHQGIFAKFHQQQDIIANSLRYKNTSEETPLQTLRVEIDRQLDQLDEIRLALSQQTEPLDPEVWQIYQQLISSLSSLIEFLFKKTPNNSYSPTTQKEDTVRLERLKQHQTMHQGYTKFLNVEDPRVFVIGMFLVDMEHISVQTTQDKQCLEELIQTLQDALMQYQEHSFSAKDYETKVVMTLMITSIEFTSPEIQQACISTVTRFNQALENMKHGLFQQHRDQQETLLAPRMPHDHMAKQSEEEKEEETVTPLPEEPITHEIHDVLIEQNNVDDIPATSAMQALLLAQSKQLKKTTLAPKSPPQDPAIAKILARRKFIETNSDDDDLTSDEEDDELFKVTQSPSEPVKPSSVQPNILAGGLTTYQQFQRKAGAIKPASDDDDTDDENDWDERPST